MKTKTDFISIIWHVLFKKATKMTKALQTFIKPTNTIPEEFWQRNSDRKPKLHVQFGNVSPLNKAIDNFGKLTIYVFVEPLLCICLVFKNLKNENKKTSSSETKDANPINFTVFKHVMFHLVSCLYTLNFSFMKASVGWKSHKGLC